MHFCEEDMLNIIMEHINSKNTFFASITLMSLTAKFPYVRKMRMCNIG